MGKKYPYHSIELFTFVFMASNKEISSLCCSTSILASIVSIRCKSVHCAYRIYLNVQSFSYRIAAFDTVIENPNKMTTTAITTTTTATKYVRRSIQPQSTDQPVGEWWMVKSTFAFRNKIRNQSWFYDLFIIRTAVVHSRGTHCIDDGWWLLLGKGLCISSNGSLPIDWLKR